MRYLMFLAVLAGGPVWADGFALRADDQVFETSALRQLLSGQVLTFYDDGRSEYYPDGRYTFTYAGDGGTAYGYWKIDDAGRVCVDFVTGFGRCDLYVRNGPRLLLLDESGNRYPVRP